MKTLPVLLMVLACALCAATPSAAAPAPAYALIDSGRFVVFSDGEPVATEDFQYEQRHDSLFVTSQVARRARGSNGTSLPYVKSMQLIANAADWAMLLYLSTEKFDNHKVNRAITLTDTSLTVSIEKDTFGTADKLDRPPGRLYVMDAGMYTLFDVIARNLNGRIFGTRPISIVALGDQNVTMDAMATPTGKDTIQWGGKRVITNRIVMGDSTGTFAVWVSPAGHMLRLESTTSDFVVMREPPALPAPVRRRRAPAR